jgi:prephenate dehydrogenase
MNTVANAPHVAIIGLGAIGGSVALALRSRGVEASVFTSSTNDASLAASAGFDVHDTLESAVSGADLVLLAAPLDVMAALATSVVTSAPSATVLHAGSLLRVEALGFTPEMASRVIGTHPMAGSHLSGFPAARADMFHGAVIYVERRGTPRQRADAELLWSLAGAARLELVDAEQHDDAMGWLSHGPQLVATALAYALACGEIDEIAGGPGVRDATRLAASDFSVWRPILERSPEAASEVLLCVSEALADLRHTLESRNWESMERIWKIASDWRRSLEPRS